MKINDLSVLVYINIYQYFYTFSPLHLVLSALQMYFNPSVPLPILFISVWIFPYTSLHSTAHLTHSQLLLGVLPISVYTMAYQALTCILDTCRSFSNCRAWFTRSGMALNMSAFLTIPRQCWCWWYTTHGPIVVFLPISMRQGNPLMLSFIIQFSHSIVSDSLLPHGLQHARLPCPSPTPGVYSNSCPLSQWCHPNISSSVVLFSSCLQSFPASGSFPMRQLFASGGRNIGVSASASVLPMNI